MIDKIDNYTAEQLRIANDNLLAICGHNWANAAKSHPRHYAVLRVVRAEMCMRCMIDYETMP